MGGTAQHCTNPIGHSMRFQHDMMMQGWRTMPCCASMSWRMRLTHDRKVVPFRHEGGGPHMWCRAEPDAGGGGDNDLQGGWGGYDEAYGE